MEDKTPTKPQSTWEIHYEKFGEKLDIKVTGTAEEGWNQHATMTLRELIHGISNHQPDTTFLEAYPPPIPPSPTYAPALLPAPEQLMLPPAKTPPPIEPTIFPDPPPPGTQFAFPSAPIPTPLKARVTQGWSSVVVTIEVAAIALFLIVIFSADVRNSMFNLLFHQPPPAKTNVQR